MKKLQKTLCLVCILCSTLLLVGCGKKEPMTAEEFAAHMEKEGFVVKMGGTDEFSFQGKGLFEDQIEQIQTVVEFGKASIKGEFYVWKDAESAKEWYDAEYKMMNKVQKMTNSKISKARSTEDFSKFTVKVESGNVIRVRIGNTTLYISAYKNDWSDVKKALSGTSY